MTHQHRFMLHGLTTSEQADAVRQALVGQAGILDAQVTIDPPESLLTVERHPNVTEIQYLVSTVGSFHVMDIQAAPPIMPEHHHDAGPPTANTHSAHHRQVNQPKPIANATNESPAAW